MYLEAGKPAPSCVKPKQLERASGTVDVLRRVVKLTVFYDLADTQRSTLGAEVWNDRPHWLIPAGLYVSTI